MKAILTITLFFLPLMMMAQTTYHVGPGQVYYSIGAVPWEFLVAGDSVIIHWRAQPYKEKWVMARQGTENHPIVVHGVPNGSNENPVIDAIDASTRPQLNFWNEGRGVIKIGGSNTPDQTPEYIVLENLKIMNGRNDYAFTGRDGLTTYSKNCAAVFIESGNHITVRNCELFNCGNGLFASSASEEILVEGCYIHGNGNAGSIYEHNNYTEAKNITFQYNRFGPLCEDCLGNNLKDRSAGTVIRYNWIEGGNRQLDLVNADGTDLYLLPEYAETWVYGNILIEPDGAGNSQIVHYGGDGGSTDTYRKGTLYFYNNTVVSTRIGNTTLFRCSTNDESVDCRNNIAFVTESGNRLAISNSDGTINLSHNWMKEGWRDSHSSLNGTINDDGTTVSNASPGFNDEAGKDFSLLQDSPCRNSATDISPGGSLDYEYIKHQQFQIRQVNAPLDIGAYEYVDVSTEVGVNKSLSREIIVFPIPAQNLLHVRNIEQYSDLKILSLTGQLIYHERIKSQDEIQIDIARFPAGIFYIILDAEDNRAVKMFVKTS